MSRKRRTFTTDFKKQVVALHENGKSRQDIVREYELTPVFIRQMDQTV